MWICSETSRMRDLDPEHIDQLLCIKVLGFLFYLWIIVRVIVYRNPYATKIGNGYTLLSHHSRFEASFF